MGLRANALAAILGATGDLLLPLPTAPTLAATKSLGASSCRLVTHVGHQASGLQLRGRLTQAVSELGGVPSPS